MPADHEVTPVGEATGDVESRRSRRRRLSVLDGQELKRALQAATAWLGANVDAVNACNVFPVPDGDTGTNMYMTMQAAMQNVARLDDGSASTIAHAVAHGALMGARGNSGVILSQILRGLARGLDKKTTFTANDLANAVSEGSRTAYHAVMRPVEGTILTVSRDTAEAMVAAAAKSDDIITVMRTGATASAASVERTPELLAMLRQAGVVDSGGKGLSLLFEGIWRYMKGEAKAPEIALSQSPSAPYNPETPKSSKAPVGGYGYEIIFMLYGQGLPVERMRAHIDTLGDCVLVVGDESLVKVHVHTDKPGRVLDYAADFGVLDKVALENLDEQTDRFADDEHYQALAREARVCGVVGVFAGEGWIKVAQSMGVSAVVPGGQTMNPSTEQLLAAIDSLPEQKVILLPNNGNVILTATQARDLTAKEVVVLLTETMPQGITALLSFNPDDDLPENQERMEHGVKSVRTGEITTAVRSVSLNGVQVRDGEVIGLVDGTLCTAGRDVHTVVWDTLKRMAAREAEVLTLYYGDTVVAEEARDLARAIKERFPLQEIEIVDGGQPHYSYVISAE